MSVFLFDEIIFGPVHSRRLGLSLGINLLPASRKVCTFDCIYCECGWTHNSGAGTGFPSSEEVEWALRERLQLMKSRNHQPDAITFAGNGEPTLHPAFPAIMDSVAGLRDEYFPEALISVLSNATRLGDALIKGALHKADSTILKLDSGTEGMFRALNNSRIAITLDEIQDLISGYEGAYAIQTMFVKGEINGVSVDNSTDKEVSAWINRLRSLRPDVVMIYSLDRGTPMQGVEVIEAERLNEIAAMVDQQTGLKTAVY